MALAVISAVMLRSLLVALVCAGLLVPSAATAGVPRLQAKLRATHKIAKADNALQRRLQGKGASPLAKSGKPRAPLAKKQRLFKAATRQADRKLSGLAFEHATTFEHQALFDATPQIASLEPSRTTSAARALDNQPALALTKGADRMTDAARYQTASGEVRLHRDGNATVGKRKYKIVGKTSDTTYVFKADDGALLSFTQKSETHGELASHTLASNHFIDNDRLLRIEGNRIKHTPHLSYSDADPDAGYVAPDGTRIMRTKPLGQAIAPSEVTFIQDEGGAYMARLAWKTDANLKPLAVPNVSLLGPDGIEYQAKQAPHEVFVSGGGDILQYRKGKIARPPPKTLLTKQELTWRDGSYAALRRLKTENAASPQIVVNRFGFPLGKIQLTPTGLSMLDFGPLDFLPQSGFAKEPGVIETTVKVKMADNSSKRYPRRPLCSPLAL